MKKVHFIAIGGSAMHNLALAMHAKGYKVTGSDDEILEPSKSRLAAKGLLPEQIGWFPKKINADLDAVILGMHARKDNPELIRATELGVKIFSYPEYIYEETKNKTRVVIGGSHGKTTITSIILHVLKQLNIDCDYMVGAQLEGFDTMVKLTEEAKIAVIEGDEYLSSPIDLRPKFHLYHPNIAIISGIAWDHINVFPTFENYVEQFKIFTDLIEKDGALIYYDKDEELTKIATTLRADVKAIPYGVPDYKIEDGITYLMVNIGLVSKQKMQLSVFGEHNLANINAAMQVCRLLNITDKDFFTAVKSFKGASKRLELVHKKDSNIVFKDFAHSPSKLKATTSAVKQQFPDKKIIACMELHTFSSLNENFLKEYNGAMEKADLAFVYFNPHTIEHKKLKAITAEQVKQAFASDNITVFTNSTEMVAELKKMQWQNNVLLMMSSGNFDGIDFKKLAEELIG
ncbi:MAG: Mur ligase family protein [Bacteroidota bacterium]